MQRRLKPIYNKPEDEGKMPPEPERKGLLDDVATWATAPLRKTVCASLRQEFNSIEKASSTDDGRAVTIQAYQALKTIEAKVNDITATIYQGGVAGAKAMIEAHRFVGDLRTRGLDLA